MGSYLVMRHKSHREYKGSIRTVRSSIKRTIWILCSSFLGIVFLHCGSCRIKSTGKSFMPIMEDRITLVMFTVKELAVEL